MRNKRKNRRRYNEEAVELNITAFLNLMVILIPFLLITAVFSKLAILELNLPGATVPQSAMAPVSINLELVVRAASFDIQESNEGLFRRFTRNTAGEDWQAFSSFLVEIKSLYPTEEGITLLLEPGIRYKTLISVMDAVKGTQIRTEGRTQFISLFPIISISDAPQAIAKSLELQARELGGAGVAQ